MNATLTSTPTISVGIDKEQDGTFTTQLWVTGLGSFAEAQAAAEHLQRLFCGEEIDPADGQPNAELSGPRPLVAEGSRSNAGLAGNATKGDSGE